MMMRKIIFYLLMFSCSNTMLYAQDTSYTDMDNVTVQAPVESTLVDTTEDYGFAPQSHGDTLLSFRNIKDAGDTVRQWKTKKEFAYLHNLDSLLSNLQEQQKKEPVKTNNRIAPPPSINLFSSGFFQLIMWGLAIFFVGFILYHLFLSKGFFKKSSTKKTKENNTVEEEENISDSDYERLLRQSYLLGDMRMAARYLFLKTLQKLNEKELITFAADKTNSDYLYEMPQAKRAAFSSLALYYEYIWYGNMAVAKYDFDKIEIKFNEFLNRL